MIGKILGAFVGGKVAQHVRGVEGPTGAAIGVLAPAILRRLSWPAMIALGVGGYLVKKVVDREAGKPSPSAVSRPRGAGSRARAGSSRAPAKG